MELQKVSKEILDQLISTTNQLEAKRYSKPLDVLSGNTIGKHIRHIIEFFDLMMMGKSTGFVNYDQRSHDKQIENDTELAIKKMGILKNDIVSDYSDFPLTLKVNYNSESAAQSLESSFFRELQYNIEHAIHHMAIIKIAISSSFPEIELPPNFGVAYSTVRYQKELECVQ